MLVRPRTHTQPAAAMRSQTTKNNHAPTNSHEQTRARKQPGAAPQSQTATDTHALAYRKEQPHTRRQPRTAMHSKMKTDKRALRERERGGARNSHALTSGRKQSALTNSNEQLRAQRGLGTTTRSQARKNSQTRANNHEQSRTHEQLEQPRAHG